MQKKVVAKAKARAAPSDGLDVLGVTFADYAFVTAGLADGLALRDLLEHRELDATNWSEVEEGWLALMLEDLDEGGALMLELDLRQQEARKIWERPIPPLDQDLRAWLDFQRGLATETAVSPRLAALGIGVPDLGRLQRTWAARLEADPKLRKLASDILNEPAAPVEVPPVPKPKLPAPARPAGTGTGFFRLDIGEVVLPFKGDDAEPDLREPAPALVLPLPAPPVEPVKPAHHLDATSTVGVVLEGLALPFVAPEEVAPPVASADAPQSVAAEAPVVPAVPAAPIVRTGGTHAAALIDDADLAKLRERIAARPRSELDETGAVSLAAIWGPALPFDGIKDAPAPAPAPGPAPAPAPAPAAAPAAAPPPASGGPKFTGTVAVTEDLDVDRLRELARMAKGLPFAAPSTVPKPPSPAAAPVGAPPEAVAGTEELDAGRLSALAKMAKSGLPFAPKTPAPSAVTSAPTAPLPRDLATVGASVTPTPPPGAATTGSTGPARSEPLAGPGTLSLEQYAAVETEIGLNPANAARVLAHYGLDALARQRHADVLRALMAREPSLRTRWQQAMATYRKWRLGR